MVQYAVGFHAARRRTVSGKEQGVKRSTWPAGAIDGLAVFVLSVLYLRALPDCFSFFDEGIFATIADRLVRGDRLYSDVVTHYMPGSFWLLMLAFKTAGSSVATLRWCLTLLASVAAVAIWSLARQQANRAAAILAGLSPIVVCYPIWWMASPHWFSTFAALGAAVLATASVTSNRPVLCLLGAGSFAGVTFLFLQPVGVAVAVLLLTAVLVDSRLATSSAIAFRRALAVAAGTAVSLAIAAVCVAFEGSLTPAVSQTLSWGLRHYSGAFRIAYGSIPFGVSNSADVRFCAHVFAFAVPPLYGLILTTLFRCYGRAAVEPRDRQLLMFSAAAFGLFVGNLYYPDVVHLATAAPAAFVALAATLARSRAAHSGVQIAVLLLWAGSLLVIGSTSLRRHEIECPATVETARGPIAATEETARDLRQLLPYVASNISPGASLFVYPYAPGYEFLLDRRNPTRYAYLLPYLPIANLPLAANNPGNEAELDEIAGELERTRPQFILLSPLSGGPMLMTYDTPVERYIRAGYHVVQTFHLTALLERDAPGRGDPGAPFQP
ncbi:MAG: hypothetical protein HY270_00660 [Deltaproteobacteria bacterium]|nr:hypothetical protein [Deltaproteobacteria bacterium]